jgi:purine-binding chemotaxis protein CheW
MTLMTTELPQSYCTFRLGEALFGVDVRLVKEVTTLPALTPVPHTPSTVQGYVNLRGQIHLVLDLKRLLKREAMAVQPETRLVLFKPVLGDPFGVLVDRIGEIVALHPDQIEDRRSPAAETSAREPPSRDLVSGIGKLDGELLVLLDARKLLPHVERSI